MYIFFQMQDQTQDRLERLQREINFRENEIEKMRGEIATKEQESNSATILSQLHGQTKSALEESLIQKDTMMRKLQGELDETRRQVDTVVLTRKAEGTAQLQMEAYRAENARLLSLLAKTKEYANFARFA